MCDITVGSLLRVKYFVIFPVFRGRNLFETPSIRLFENDVVCLIDKIYNCVENIQRCMYVLLSKCGLIYCDYNFTESDDSPLDILELIC